MSVINHRLRRNNRNKRRRSDRKQKKRIEFRNFFSQKRIGQYATCRALKQNAPKSFLKCEHKSFSYKKCKNESMNRFVKPAKKEENKREMFVTQNLKEIEQFNKQMWLVKIWLETHVYPRMLPKDKMQSIDKMMESMSLAQKEDEVKEMEQIFQKLRVRDGKPLSITENRVYNP